MSRINCTKEIPEGNFHINLKLIDKHHKEHPSIMDKYKEGTYYKYSFLGRINTYLKLVTCEDKIGITSILQSYVFHWYHMYILHPKMYRTEAIIRQKFYLIGIRDAVWKEVTNCDICQCTKRSDKKYGRLTAREDEETPWNKLCVNIICT